MGMTPMLPLRWPTPCLSLVLLLLLLLGVGLAGLHCQPGVASAASRSPQWPSVRDAFLKQHPECAACGSKGSKLQVHHIIPFSVDADGDADGDGISNELDTDNLITLCIDGVGHTDCHLMIGHGGNFRCHNPNAVRDAKRFREMLAGKVCGRGQP